MIKNKSDTESAIRNTRKKPKEKKSESIFVQTRAKYLKISPRKLRLVINKIKKMPVRKAMIFLEVWNKKAARLLLKAIRTVVADAENNFDLDVNNLKFVQITADDGPRLKRVDKSHGARFDSGVRQKRMSHLKIIVVGNKK